MTTPRASGPLWTFTRTDGVLNHTFALPNGPVSKEDVPCRLIPGHGKVVPVELVTAINIAIEHYTMRGDQGDYANLCAAIDAAIKGAI